MPDTPARSNQPGKTQRIEIHNRDGVVLSARLDLPVGRPPAACAVFAHCFTCSKNLAAVRNISRALTAEGIAVLRFDFTGLGDSDGEFEETNFTSNVADLIDACNYLSEHHEAPAILIGHSLGGAAVLAAAGEVESVQAVATIAAPAHPAHVKAMFRGCEQALAEQGEATVQLAGRSFKIKQQLIDDLVQDGHHERIKRMRKALLVFHSPTDQTVGIENAREIYDAAMHPKSFIGLDGADHLLMDRRDSRYVGAMIAAWAERHIPALEARERAHATAAEDEVVVSTGKDGFLTFVEADGHSLLADEPVSVGGTDLGPSPYEYLLVALGTCTTMTMRMYADLKKLPLDQVEVRLNHRKLHVKDLEGLADDLDTHGGKIDQIERRITLRGDLDENQRGRLMKIADKCPVHRTLHHDVLIDTTEVPES